MRHALVLAVAMLAMPAAAGPIADHRAVYDMSLARAGPGTGIQGIGGEMTIEVRDKCDVITVSQRIATELFREEGAADDNELTISSVERVDGSAFEFATQNRAEGEVTEKFRGKARRGKGDAPGTISYEAGAFPKSPLPRDAIFPSEHMRRLLAAAESGKQLLSVLVFDGSENGKIYRASAIVGRRKQGGAVPSELKGLAHWPVTISYFPAASQEPLPEYETSFELFSNGVTGNITVDYPEFSMKGQLIALHLLPKTGCPGRRPD